MNPTVHYRLYQMKHTSENRDAKFRSYSALKTDGLVDKVTKDNYTLVYESETENNDDVYRILDRLFEQFNIRHPADFKGHSLSVSDVIILENDIYYVDSVGFTKLESF